MSRFRGSVMTMLLNYANSSERMTKLLEQLLFTGGDELNVQVAVLIPCVFE